MASLSCKEGPLRHDDGARDRRLPAGRLRARVPERAGARPARHDHRMKQAASLPILRKRSAPVNAAAGPGPFPGGSRLETARGIPYRTGNPTRGRAPGERAERRA